MSFTFRDRLYINRRCCQISFARALLLSIAETFDWVRYHSATGQDKWVLLSMFPGVTDGFFLDVGSADAVLNSNSKALEDRGWHGICVDPFPSNTHLRRCQVVRAVVSEHSGERVRFHGHGELGGIADSLGRWRAEAEITPAVEMTTVTLGEILDQTRAPSFIHFLSLDVEGAELAALRGLPFERYRFGAMAIEHNEEEPKRTDILNFLASKGYRRVHSYKQDDFYAP